MKLIEEFMVLAMSPPRRWRKQDATDLRVHDTPSKEKLSPSPIPCAPSISASPRAGVQPGAFNHVSGGQGGVRSMNDVVLRSQAQAIYNPANIGHFGLNLARYAHFTSPIRRYADLIVHRALIRAFKLGDDGLSDREIGTLAGVAEHITVTERRAMAAERDSTDRMSPPVEDCIGQSFRRA